MPAHRPDNKEESIETRPASAHDVTNKPRKKDSDMKIDKTTYKDKENQIGLTDNRTSRPEKVLFFADTHFLFFKSRPTFGTLPFARHTNQRFAKVKEPNFSDTQVES